MVSIIFTLDYELHGNGEGCAHNLMVEPTRRMLRLFDRYGAKLTIMADVAEILKFREYEDSHGTDRYRYRDIVAQLQRAVRHGHDVQLHIHSSYFNAFCDGEKWRQDWTEYNFAGLPLERVRFMVRKGKEFLESVLRPGAPNYKCMAFRAANWSVSPSSNVAQALIENGISIDTSIFKYGRRNGMVTFDYSSAVNEMLPWRASAEALWQHDPEGKIWEVPIYTEERYLPAFLSINRVCRAIAGRLHKVPSGGNNPPASARSSSGIISKLTRKHAWKADFNQCTGRQLIRALSRAAERYHDGTRTLPFVLIGHSKLFNRWNERSLRPFLEFVASNPTRFSFGTFGGLNLESQAVGASCQVQF